MRPPRQSYVPLSLLPPCSLSSSIFVLHFRLAFRRRLVVKLFPVDLYRLAGKRCVSL
jgi:hypothetical protein